MTLPGGGRCASPVPFSCVTAMYICICNALTQRRIREAIRDHAPATVAEVHAACGVVPQCGRCGDAIADMLDEAYAPAFRLAAE